MDLHQASPNSCVDDKLNDSSKIKNTGHVDFIIHNFDNVGFVEATSCPNVGEQLTAKYYVDKAIRYRRQIIVFKIGFAGTIETRRIRFSTC